MLDGQGQLRITDFGLAGVAGEVKDIRSGTPAYMAPEQRSGKEVTARSDIYALGMVLHEVFTGRGFSADSSHPDLAPEEDRVIRRCLAEDPAKRPASALAVSAALPGGDPLAAALAAGETPSPEMVAAAGDSDSVSVRTIGICAALILAGLVAAVVLGGRTSLLANTPFPKSPAVLEQRAKDVIQSLGYTEPPADRVYGFRYATDYQRYAEKQEKPATYRAQLAKGQPPLIYFWYRQSPQYLEAAPEDDPIDLVSFRRFPHQSAADPCWNGRLESGSAGPPDRVQRRSSAGGRNAGSAAPGGLDCVVDRRRPGHDPLRAGRAAVDTLGELRRAGGVDRIVRACAGGAVANRGCVLARKAGDISR